MPFKFSAKYALLTYSQCGSLDPFGIMDHLSTMGAECIIGREYHLDGGTHLHVFCDFGRKFQSRRVDVFDVGGYHPNIVKSYGSPEKGYDYAIKDGEVVCGGLGRPEPTTSGDRVGKADIIWSRITQAESRDEFWELVLELAPKAAATSFPSLQRFCDWKYRIDPPTYETPTGARFTSGEFDGRDFWLSQAGLGHPRHGRVKSLVLYGETQTGKTTWARSLGSHVYCVGLVSGSELRKVAEVEYAVFDDLRGGFKFFHSFKEWMGCQPHVCIKEMYKEPAYVTWGKPSIYCANTDPRIGLDEADIHWLNANCVFVEITTPIVEFN